FLSARVVDAQPVYRFARETDRHAWLDAMEPKRRAAAQADVGGALEQAGDVVAAAALAWALGATPAAAALAARAGDELSARGAHEDAADLYARALTVVQGAERARVLERLGQVLAAQGDFGPAARALLAS